MKSHQIKTIVGPLIDTHAVEMYNKALEKVVAEGGKILVEVDAKVTVMKAGVM